MTLDNPSVAAGIATLPSGAQIVHVLATKTLSIFERLVFCTSNTANPSFTLTLPDVAEAAGLWFYIRADIADSKQVTVEDNGGDAGLGDIALDGDNEYIIIFSSGKEWIEVHTVGYS